MQTTLVHKLMRLESFLYDLMEQNCTNFFFSYTHFKSFFYCFFAIGKKNRCKKLRRKLSQTIISGKTIIII